MYRFHGHGSLNYLFRNGQTTRSAQLLIRSVENRRRKDSRVTVVVGKKVAKSAVVRNRIRRRVYEVVRRHWDMIPEHVDFSITVLSPEVALIPPDAVQLLVSNALHKAGLYRPNS